MTTTAELKPCPFCGGAAEVKRIGNDHTKKRAVHIGCSTVGCSIEVRVAALKYSHDWCEEKATGRWNARIESDLSEQLEQQTMMLAACSTVAYANTKQSANLTRDMHPDYMCAAVSDVCLAVDREMVLIEQLEQLKDEKHTYFHSDGAICAELMGMQDKLEKAEQQLEQAEKAIGESCEDMRSEYRTCSLAADLTEQLEQAAVKAISQKGLIDNLNVVVTNQAEQLKQVKELPTYKVRVAKDSLDRVHVVLLSDIRQALLEQS
jgi:hypothetical protein